MESYIEVKEKFVDNAAGRLKRSNEQSVPCDGQTVEAILKALYEEVNRVVNVQTKETVAS